ILPHLYPLLSSILRHINLVEYCDTPARSRGPPAEFYSRLWRFLLAAPGFYSQRIDVWASHQPPILWTQQATATRPFKAFILFGCNRVSQCIPCTWPRCQPSVQISRVLNVGGAAVASTRTGYV